MWLIVGAGVTGRAAARYLRKVRDEDVRISDSRPLAEPVRSELTALGVEVFDGGHQINHLDRVSNVLVSPGLTLGHPLLAGARVRGIAIKTDLDLALSDFNGKTVLVTGTNGKSTTTAMIDHVLAGLGYRPYLSGNFGRSPLEALTNNDKIDVFVVEVSSYQLEWSAPLKCDVAVWTNLAPDHLDHHGSFENYVRAKSRITHLLSGALVIHGEALKEAERLSDWRPAPLTFRFQESGKTLASDHDFSASTTGISFVGGRTISFGGAQFNFGHDYINGAFAALAAAEVAQAPIERALAALAGFKGLESRCEVFAHFAGKRIINDSKATNVDSVLNLICQLKEPYVLLLGGRAKQESFAPMLEHLGHCASVITFGESREKIAGDLAGTRNLKIFERCADACNAAFAEIAKTPMAVAFSPGCASFDEFTDFLDRGRKFKALVTQGLKHDARFASANG